MDNSERKTRVVLSEDDKLRLYDLIINANNRSLKSLAKEFDISYGTVSRYRKEIEKQTGTTARVTKKPKAKLSEIMNDIQDMQAQMEDMSEKIDAIFESLCD